MSLKKQYNEKTSVCKVTFKLAKEISSTADHATLAGNFNNWDIESIPMKKVKGGEFAASVELEKGKEYQFKYLVDGKEWMNDSEADKLVANQFQGENSVIIL